MAVSRGVLHIKSVSFLKILIAPLKVLEAKCRLRCFMRVTEKRLWSVTVFLQSEGC